MSRSSPVTSGNRPKRARSGYTQSDHVVDLGPGAGHDGGRIVFEGTLAALVAARSTPTGAHLAAHVGTGASTVDRSSS